MEVNYLYLMEIFNLTVFMVYVLNDPFLVVVNSIDYVY